MKKALIVAALVLALPIVYLVRNHTNYGEYLPPGLPSDVVVVDGQVISGRRTLFEDGKGYVIDVRTELPYREVLEFYAERYGNDRIAAASGMGAEFSIADFRLGSKRVLIEIYARDAATIVTTAVHLGTWW